MLTLALSPVSLIQSYFHLLHSDNWKHFLLKGKGKLCYAKCKSVLKCNFSLNNILSFFHPSRRCTGVSASWATHQRTCLEEQAPLFPHAAASMHPRPRITTATSPKGPHFKIPAHALTGTGNSSARQPFAACCPCKGTVLLVPQALRGSKLGVNPLPPGEIPSLTSRPLSCLNHYRVSRQKTGSVYQAGGLADSGSKGQQSSSANAPRCSRLACCLQGSFFPKLSGWTRVSNSWEQKDAGHSDDVHCTRDLLNRQQLGPRIQDQPQACHWSHDVSLGRKTWISRLLHNRSIRTTGDKVKDSCVFFCMWVLLLLLLSVAASDEPVLSLSPESHTTDLFSASSLKRPRW